MDTLPQIVNKAAMLTLLGGGFAGKSDLHRALALAPVLVAADGGANLAMEWGVLPDAVIGDLDSVDRLKAESKGVPLVHVEDQNSTDFEKCLNATQARVVLGIGFLGGRLDHQMACLNALSKEKDRCVVLVGAQDIAFRVPQSFTLGLHAGDRVSLFPMSDVQASSRGLRWALDGLPFQPNGQIGCSNEALGGDMHVQIDAGDMLMILPKTLLLDVITALCRAMGISTQAG